MTQNPDFHTKPAEQKQRGLAVFDQSRTVTVLLFIAGAFKANIPLNSKQSEQLSSSLLPFCCLKATA
jgi:hypothetical protein